jgi:hypothetical protein
MERILQLAKDIETSRAMTIDKVAKVKSMPIGRRRDVLLAETTQEAADRYNLTESLTAAIIALMEPSWTAAAELSRKAASHAPTITPVQSDIINIGDNDTFSHSIPIQELQGNRVISTVAQPVDPEYATATLGFCTASRVGEYIVAESNVVCCLPTDAGDFTWVMLPDTTFFGEFPEATRPEAPYRYGHVAVPGFVDLD